MELKIEYVDLEELTPYLNNAKIHTAEQIGQIKKSIEEFGMNDPIAVWKDNEIIEGHGRLIALKELGWHKAPVVKLDHLTDEQRNAYMLVHNKLTMNTGFDFDVLTEELESIFDVDMEFFGFEKFDVDFNYEDIEKEYGEAETKSTVTNIVIMNDSEERFVMDLLKEEKELRKIYKASELMKKFDEENN